jgi:hypothetical protein
MPSSRSCESLPAAKAHNLLIEGKGWPGIRVHGSLKLTGSKKPVRLPEGMDVEALDLSDWADLEELPAGLRCFELNASNTKIREVPADLVVESVLNLSNCEELLRLPPGLTVGTLNLSGCRSLRALPENLDVWFLDMTGCWSFREWPRQAKVRAGRLTLRGCAALTELPAYLGPLAALNIRDCPNLRELPKSLRISGWIDVAQSGIAESRRLPKTLDGVDLRWQGVRIDRRVVVAPRTITVAEVLAEQNAERRRVLLDRFGVSRFMSETKAEVLDEDDDTGGRRQLLRVALPEDEPLVTLSCFCPSTGRQYFLRVPPNTATCRQAAAWIAGFDNPDDYTPLLET